MRANASNLFTGFVIPVGNGAVGKSSIGRVLDGLSPGNHGYQRLINSVRKTNNLEFEFIPESLTYRDRIYRVMIQMLIPPGQKRSEGDRTSRSFEDVIDIYRFHIRRVDVVLFTYNLTSQESFFDIGQWLHSVSGLCREFTHFVLLGTHLDLVDQREVGDEQIDAGVTFLKSQLKGLIPNWRGKCYRHEVSNLTGDRMRELKQYLAWSILHARYIAP